MELDKNTKTELIKNFKNNEFIKVELEIGRLLKNMPNNVFLWKLLGMTCANLKKNKNAITAYKKVIQLSPNDAESNNNYGYILWVQGQDREAEHFFKKAIKLKKNYPQAIINLLELYKKENNFEKAEELLKSNYLNNKNSIKLQLDLGLILKKIGKFDEAIQVYKNAISINPNLPELYNNLANLQRLKGNFSDAERNYQFAIKLNPNLSEAYNNLGNIKLIYGKFTEAILNYKQSIKINPNLLKSHINLGKIYTIIKNYQKAKLTYLNALKIDENCFEAKHMINVLNGNDKVKISTEYVRNIFDDYADTFDHSLTHDLNYKVPIFFKNIILNNTSNLNIGKVLDLGCGTGLIGEQIKNYCEYIEGVDISNLMLKKAEQKKIYNKLVHEEIIDYLKNKPLNYDYFIFGDVLIYFRDLDDIFKLIKNRNNSNCKILFTTEHSSNKKYQLEMSGRFSHSKKYIENLTKKFGYTLSYYKKEIIRKENFKNVYGGIYLLKI
jgi:predicted TPR repeat methyltransferase